MSSLQGISIQPAREPALEGILRLFKKKKIGLKKELLSSGAGHLIVIAMGSSTEGDRYKNGQDLRLSPEHTNPRTNPPLSL